MDICKLHTGNSDIIKIEREIFERETQKHRIYYQQNPNSTEQEKIVPFAVCPACDNPIQIIGLYKKLKNTDKPYGRHYSKDVLPLAKYSQEAYDYCPYANPRKFSKESRRSKISQLARDILQILKERFDKAIYIISEDTGIVIKENLAETMLKTYIKSEGYLYTGATRMNVPWILAYMSNSNSLFGRIVKDNILKEALSTVPGLVINEKGQVQNDGKVFLDVNFCFCGHSIKHAGNTATESMDFLVTNGKPGKSSIVYEKKIVIDPLRFQNVTYENKKMLATAKEILESAIGGTLKK